MTYIVVTEKGNGEHYIVNGELEKIRGVSGLIVQMNFQVEKDAEEFVKEQRGKNVTKYGMYESHTTDNYYVSEIEGYTPYCEICSESDMLHREFYSKEGAEHYMKLEKENKRKQSHDINRTQWVKDIGQHVYIYVKGEKYYTTFDGCDGYENEEDIVEKIKSEGYERTLKK